MKLDRLLPLALAFVGFSDIASTQPNPSRSFSEWLVGASTAGRLYLPMDQAEAARFGLRTVAPAPGGLVWVSADPARLPLALQRSGPSRWVEPDSRLKLSEELRGSDTPDWASATLHGEPAVDVDVTAFPDADLLAARRQLESAGADIQSEQPEFNRIRARMNRRRIDEVAAFNWVLSVESIPPPRKEFSNALSASLIHATQAQAAPYNLTGEAIRVGVIDGGRVDASQPEFGDRVTLMDQAAVSEHSTHVAGTIAAAGQNNPSLRGMAPRALLYSGTFSGDTPAKLAAARATHMLELSNNSWGAAISDDLRNCNSFGTYGTMEREYDRLTGRDGVLSVFAMGNNRNDDICALMSRGGFYTTSRPASAKNVIAVAAIDNTRRLSEFSGFGPARDGRLKPDITAPGVRVESTLPGTRSGIMSGTSMSTPAITGGLALLAQRYRAENGQQAPPALLKALLLNSAFDLGNPGPDYAHGYGLADITEALKSFDDKQFAVGLIGAGESRKHQVEVPAGTAAVRVMLLWSDSPGVPGAETALVNDLDLTVKLQGSGDAKLPLTLDPLRPWADASPGVNRRDNSEQVVIRHPEAGTYEVEVAASSIKGPEPEQQYVVVWSLAPSDDPPCELIPGPSEVTAPVRGGTVVFTVAKSRACPPWTASTDASWLKVKPDGAMEETGPVKLTVDPNPGPARTATVRVNQASVLVSQNAQCVPRNIGIGDRVTDVLTVFDCLTDEGTFARQYTFRGVAGQSIRIDLTSRAFDAWLELRLPDGSLLATDDDSGGDSNARIPTTGTGYVLPFTGAYTIVATTFDPDELGSYTLTLTAVQAAGTDVPPKEVSACPATQEGTLNAQSSRAGYRGDLYYADVYSFFGRLGAEVEAVVESANVDTVIYLVSGDRRFVAMNDDGEGVPSRIRATLPTTGPWRLEVTTFAAFTEGSYKVTLSGCQPPPQP